MPSSWSPLVRTAGNVNTLIRAIIAGVVIFVSFQLAAAAKGGITPEWEAVFLVVVGYYFKDRPREDSLVYSVATGEGTEKNQVMAVLAEMLAQFIIALALIALTVMAFLLRGDETISGAWIGAVVLAVGFYFKETNSPLHAVHELFRTILAASVALLTLLFISKLYGKAPQVPLQWVGIVFIVVAFYFKEKLEPSSYAWLKRDRARLDGENV